MGHRFPSSYRLQAYGLWDTFRARHLLLVVDRGAARGHAHISARYGTTRLINGRGCQGCLPPWESERFLSLQAAGCFDFAADFFYDATYALPLDIPARNGNALS